MRTLNVIFTDEEHSKLEKLKNQSGLNWHDFIMKCLECIEAEE